jgi:hypothetical protein
MQRDSVVQTWSALAGVVLIAVGLLAFVSNPLVGNGNALIPTGTIHNVVHIATGLLALYIAFGLRGRQQADGVIGFGILYVIIFVVVVLSPTLFGLFDYAANIYLHLIHAALAVVSLAVGYMARSASGTMASQPTVPR